MLYKYHTNVYIIIYWYYFGCFQVVATAQVVPMLSEIMPDIAIPSGPDLTIATAPPINQMLLREPELGDSHSRSKGGSSGKGGKAVKGGKHGPDQYTDVWVWNVRHGPRVMINGLWCPVNILGVQNAEMPIVCVFSNEWNVRCSAGQNWSWPAWVVERALQLPPIRIWTELYSDSLVLCLNLS